MNKINPLFEAISNIDDNIASDAVKETHKRTKKFKILLTAAATATFCLLTTVTVSAVKIFTAPRSVTINSVSVAPSYGVARMGYEVMEYYVIDVPEEFLTEGEEEYTPVGDVKVIPNPDYPSSPHKWIITDAVGNTFIRGINNKIVTCDNAAGVGGLGFDCINFDNEKYDYIQVNSEKDKTEFVFLPKGQGEEYLRQRFFLNT